MVSKKNANKLVAIILAIVLVAGVIPVSLLTTAFATEVSEETTTQVNTETSEVGGETPDVGGETPDVPTETPEVPAETVVNVTGDGTTIYYEEDDTEITSGSAVPVGSKIYVKVEQKENYTLKVTPNADRVDGNKYYFTVGEEKLDISVEYTAITYDVTVDIGDNLATVTPEKVIVNKTEKTTEVVITPKEHYSLTSLTFNGKKMTEEAERKEDGKYHFIIDNSKVTENSTLKLIFGIDTFPVKIEKTENGKVTLVTESINESNVDWNTELTYKVEPDKGYAITGISVNGSPVDLDRDSETGELKDSFTFTVTEDTTINVTFEKVDTETLKDFQPSDAFDVTFNGDNSYNEKGSNTYYLGKDTSASVKYKTEIKNSENIIVLDNVKSMKIKSATKDEVKYYLYQSSNDTISALTVKNKEGIGKYKSYLVPGTIEIRVDNKAPEISNISPNTISHTNKDQEIKFTVSDPTETYNKTEYASGIKSVTVTRSYKDKDNNSKNELVYEGKTAGEHIFIAKPVTGITCDVTYTITATDNVNNVSLEKTITVQNDTQAPVKASIKFNKPNELVSIFNKILETISFGKWTGNQMTVKFSAKDAGVGFGGENSKAKVYLVFEDENGKLYYINNEKSLTDATATDATATDAMARNGFAINKDGIATINIKAGDLPDGVFKGKVYFYACDALGNWTDKTQITTGNSNIGDNNSSGIIMIEEDAPTIIIESVALGRDKIGGKNYNNIYNGDVQFNIAISDIAASPAKATDATLTDATPTDAVTEKDKNISSGICSYTIYNVKINGDIEEAVEVASYKPESDAIEYKLNDSITTEGITPNEDGSYVIVVEVTDNAGNVSKNTMTVYKDTTAATIKGFDFTPVDNRDVNKNNDTKLFDAVEITDYGFYFKENVDVTICAEDIKVKNETNSGVKSITYKAVDIDGEIKYQGSGLEDGDKITFTIDKNFKGQIYAYATDNLENSCTEVHPNGTILETTDKHSNTSAIEIKASKASGTQNTAFSYENKADDCIADEKMAYDASKNVPLYNSNPEFEITVTDNYSGIRNIKCTVIEGGKETVVNEVEVDGFIGAEKETTIEGWAAEFETGYNIVTKMSKNITVSGNYNDMVLRVELTDRAGNKSYDYYAFGIDKTAPLIEVAYDNNSGDSQSGTGTYFKANRTATITVSERNFNKENVNFIIKNAEGGVPNVKFVKEVKGTGNGDNTKHIFEVTYSNDGVYSFSMNYTDRATNKNNGIDYKDSLAPTSFIIDKTLPTISVSYDNNEAQNEKFFKAHRTATITIVEHNFDVNRVVVTQTASVSGKEIAKPSVSWVNNGDTHIGTINYNADGDYTFDITMTDKAANKEAAVNYGKSVAAKDFTVDTTYKDIVKVEGITKNEILGLQPDGTVNPNASITVTINDINLDKYNVKLTRSRVFVSGETDNKADSKENVIDNPEKQCAENNVDVTSEFVPNASGTANAKITINIPEKTNKGVKNDGLYTLTIEAKDKAGNAYNTQANTITFSVNRFGSVFTFSKDLYDVITENDGYTNKDLSKKNFEIYEYNTTAINGDKASVELIANNDSKSLKQSENYTFSEDAPQQTKTSWHKYTYNIKPENFVKDGVYTIRVKSTDTASNTSQTVSYDICSARFIVDKTAPNVTSLNYSTEVSKMLNRDAASAKTDELNVDFTVEDFMGLEKVEVYVNDTLQNTYTYGKDFNDVNMFDQGEVTMYDGGSSEQSFRIVVTDKAGNKMDTSKDEFEPGYVFFDKIAVSANAVALFYANKMAFWGTVSGVAVIAAGIIIFIVAKKRKKDDDDGTANQQT